MNVFYRMATSQKVVLLACGSFNPPTNMHLRMFELGRDHLQRSGKYSVVGGIMSPVSDAYNKKDLMSAKHRCAMVKLAIKSSKWIRLDSWESEQPTWLETARVLMHHRVELNNQANTVVRATPSKKRRKDKKNEDEIDRGGERIKEDYEHVSVKLLCGGDLLESFAVPGLWKDEDIEEIVSKYGLVCITRGGSDPRKFIYESDVLTKHQDNIHIVTEWIQNEISATKIRRALRRGESVKYLLQDSVIDYIRDHQLYGIPCDNKYMEKLLSSPVTDCNQDMDFVDGAIPGEEDIGEVILTPMSPRLPPALDAEPRSPRHMIDKPGPGSPRHYADVGVLRSPKRMMQEEEDDGSKSPKSPQNVPCMSDLGTIVRRVRNYNLQGIFHPKKIQPRQ